MKRVIEFFVPSEKKFYHLISNASKNAFHAGSKLHALIGSFSSLDEHGLRVQASEISGIQRDGDVITREIVRELFSTFITPIDREDIHELVSLIDAQTDLIEGLSRKISNYHFSKLPSLAIEQAEIVKSQLSELSLAVECLESGKAMTTHYDEVVRLERRGDEAYGQGMSELFNGYSSNVLEVVKLKDLHDTFESLINKNRQVATVLERIVIKHA